jgi:ATP-grasp ribosomal peptide maturase
LTRDGEDPILILTQAFDPTADCVVEELNRRGAPVFRCDPGEFPTRLTLAARLGEGWTGSLRLPDRTLCLDRVGCVYYRRPSMFELPDDLAEARWALAEARMGLGGVLSALPRWLNHPADIARSEYKPVQLAQARAAGLLVPETLITNDPDEARRFVAGRDAVYKPLTATWISGSRILYTTPVTEADCDESIRHTAHLFQERIAKQYEIRATYIDGIIHAARLDTASEKACSDWRADYAGVRYSIARLPDPVAEAVDRLMRALRLRFGALDLIVAPDDEHWFLEVNPNGQWGWIEDATGLPIAASIADALQRE